MNTIVFALATHPNVRKKAQEEVEVVLGARCLPDYLDLNRLPYCRAIFIESLRWRTVGVKEGMLRLTVQLILSLLLVPARMYLLRYPMPPNQKMSTGNGAFPRVAL